MTKKKQEIITLLLSAAILIFAALVTWRFFFRADMTENKIYSISKVSRNLFNEIPEQVTITYYFSDRLGEAFPQFQQIEDLLNEYAAHSRGKISVQVIDPVKENAAGEADNFGVVPQEMQDRKEGEVSYANVYTGIVIRYLDRWETIPVVSQPETLEYELTSRIKRIVSNTQRSVGILLGRDDLNLQQNLRYLTGTLSRSFDLRPLTPGEDIPDDISVLLILGSRSLDSFELFPVDQFIMRGGRALFALDGVHIDLQANLAPTPVNSPLMDFLGANGIRVEQSLLLDKYALKFPATTNQGNVQMTRWVEYPHWFQVPDTGASGSHPVTARFSSMDVFWPSPISFDEGVSGAEAVLSSSPDGWIMTENYNVNPHQVLAAAQTQQQTRGEYTIAAAYTGPVSSYFEGRSIPRREGVSREWDEIIPGTGDSRIMIIGDSDFLMDLLLQQFSSNPEGNLSFISNTVEWLTNDEDLLEIKTRTVRDMRLNDIENPGRKQFTVFAAQFINVFLIPLLVIVYGIIRMLKRRETALIKREEK
ncbi:MAG: GldG family protein [Spirochaetia bacterium]